MTTLQLDHEIARQLGLISGNVDLKKKVLDYLKGLTAQLKIAKKDNKYEMTDKADIILRQLDGCWAGEADTDEMEKAILSIRNGKARNVEALNG